MASFVESVLTPLISLIQEPLVRRVSYVVKVGEKVKNLEEKMKDLKMLSEDIESDIRSEVEETKRRDQTRRPTQQVNGWLDRVPPMENEVSDIKFKYEKLGRWCFGRSSGDIISMYKIGRDATVKLEEVTDLYQKLQEQKYNQSLTQPAPTPPGQEMPGTSNLIATESYLSKVLGYLADGVGVVGIFGMGGVGKTTLLKRINNSLSRGGNINSNSVAVSAVADDDGGKRVHFDHVIWVTVSRDGADVQRLQDDFAKQLKLPADGNHKISLANKISNVLTDKRFVVLLDDVWEGLDLNKIGIPDKGRTVVFTTRSEDVCGEMKAKKNVKVDVLTPEDAWRLFQENVTNEHMMSDTEIGNIARQIAEECKGLPLALITIGRAMSTKKTVGEWRHALKSLKNSQLAAAIPKANADMIMTSLKFSYDHLDDEKIQQCFLCCALFPEDYDILKVELIECLLGHGVINSDEFDDIVEMYDYGDTLIGRLTSACLLESTQSEHTVQECMKMHDIIRDMALWIANDCKKDNSKWVVRAGLWSEEPLRKTDKWESANRISLMFNKMKALPEPKQSCPNLSTLMIQRNYDVTRIPETFFQHFPALTYLDMSHTSIEIFPEEVTMLVQLQYLNLSSTCIASLSSNLKALVKLRYLILCDCEQLKDIPEELISSLPSLQMLDLFGSESIAFDLSIHPPNREVKELKRLKGRMIKALGLKVKLREFSSLDECVDCTSIWKLTVCGCPSDSPVRDTLIMGKNIQTLWLREFESLQKLTMSSDDQDGQFPQLRELGLYDLSRLEKICWERPTTLETFPQLMVVWITGCPMKDISWIGHATCLKILDIRDCEKLSDIIVSYENVQKGHQARDECRPPVTFSNLRYIMLWNLPSLHNIYKGTIHCPLLEELDVWGCECLTRLPFNFRQHITGNRPLRIVAESSAWWGALKWEDDEIKSQLQRFVHFRNF